MVEIKGVGKDHDMVTALEITNQWHRWGGRHHAGDRAWAPQDQGVWLPAGIAKFAAGGIEPDGES